LAFLSWNLFAFTSREIVWHNDHRDNDQNNNGKIGGRLEMGGDAPVRRKILFIEQAVNLVPQLGRRLRMNASHLR
jgi:hypothetical protein